MFCTNCGSKIANDANFCTVCGYHSQNAAIKINPNVGMAYNQYQVQKQQMRQSELGLLNKAYAYFSIKKNQFSEYDVVCQMNNAYCQPSRIGVLVSGFLIILFGIIIGIEERDFLTFGLLFIFPGTLMMIINIALIINNSVQRKKCLERYAVLSQELYAHYCRYPSCPIGVQYCNPRIIAKLIQTIQSGRADTIKEALNVIISDVNQAALQRYMYAIEKNTRAINSQTRVAAIFAAANFFC